MSYPSRRLHPTSHCLGMGGFGNGLLIIYFTRMVSRYYKMLDGNVRNKYKLTLGGGPRKCRRFNRRLRRFSIRYRSKTPKITPVSLIKQHAFVKRWTPFYLKAVVNIFEKDNY